MWKGWRPWLALIGLVGPVGVLLVQFSIFLSSASEVYVWIIQNYRYIDPALLEQTGLTLRHGIPLLVCYSLLLLSWSWIGGFVLGSLSRRTIWVNGAVFCSVWLLFSDAILRLPTVLFLIPFIGGAHQGLRLGAPRRIQAIFLAATTASLTAFAIWSGGLGHGRAWQIIQLTACLVLSWPVWYMIAIASSRHGRNAFKENNV